VALEPRKRIWW